MIVTLQDAKDLHFCSRGMREFFKRNGLDFLDFCHNGIPAETLEKFDHAHVQQLVAYAKEKHGRI